jgi:DNA-binding Lrp family transcriptional regulator
MSENLDSTDFRILDCLQQDASLTNVELAGKVSLSPSPTLSRVKKLEADGVISRYVALVDPHALGLKVNVFVRVSLEKQEAAVQKPKVLAQMPQELVLKEMKGIVGFRIDITEFQAVEKLSQNRDSKNHQAIITELEQSNDTSSHAIARLMKKIK